MTADEFKEFMDELLNIYSDRTAQPYEMTPARLNAYWSVLRIHEIEAVVLAANRHFQQSRFFPEVSDLLALIRYRPAGEAEPLALPEAPTDEAADDRWRREINTRFESDVAAQVAAQRAARNGALFGPREGVPAFRLPEQTQALPFVRQARRLYRCHQCLDAEWIVLACPDTPCGRPHTHGPHDYVVRCPHWYEANDSHIRRNAAAAVQKGEPVSDAMRVVEEIAHGRWPFLTARTRS